MSPTTLKFSPEIPRTPLYLSILRYKSNLLLWYINFMFIWFEIFYSLFLKVFSVCSKTVLDENGFGVVFHIQPWPVRICFKIIIYIQIQPNSVFDLIFNCVLWKWNNGMDQNFYLMRKYSRARGKSFTCTFEYWISYKVSTCIDL